MNAWEVYEADLGWGKHHYQRSRLERPLASTTGDGKKRKH